MSTSIIDYVFRELAITYLDRNDLAQVTEEDLRADTTGRPAAEPDFDEEVESSTRVVDDEAERTRMRVPRTKHLKVGFLSDEEIPEDEQTIAIHQAAASAAGSEADARLGVVASTAASPVIVPVSAATGHASIAAPAAAARERELIRQARIKGYEGDPCSECGQFTMVRNGTCLKCISCGATSGCS